MKKKWIKLNFFNGKLFDGVVEYFQNDVNLLADFVNQFTEKMFEKEKLDVLDYKDQEIMADSCDQNSNHSFWSKMTHNCAEKSNNFEDQLLENIYKNQAEMLGECLDYFGKFVPLKNRIPKFGKVLFFLAIVYAASQVGALELF